MEISGSKELCTTYREMTVYRFLKTSMSWFVSVLCWSCAWEDWVSIPKWARREICGSISGVFVPNVFVRKTKGAFHLIKISGISGSAVNGTRFVGSSHWKIPRKSGKSKKVVPFSRLEFPNGMSCSIYVSCSLYQFQVHGRAPSHVPGFTTKWNNFLPIGNSTFATTEISGFLS